MLASELATDLPSRSDRLIRSLSEGVGGPIGRHAVPSQGWWSPSRVVLLVATMTYLLGMIFRLPCRITAPGQAPDWFKLMCYSDIPLLYADRGLLQGNTPYVDSGGYQVLEYPPLIGWFLELERLLAQLLGGPQGVVLTEQQKIDSTLLFFDINAVLLGALFLITVWAQLNTVPGRPWDTMMLAASPCVALASLINWDMLAVALTAVGLLLWSRRRPSLTGLALGLAAAAKLYPAFLLGPLLLLCLRSRRMRDFGSMFMTFLLGWLAANLPVAALASGAWLSFWQFNFGRDGDLGSIWYVLSLAGFPVPHLNLISIGLFAAACLGIAALIIFAPRRPRLGAVAFLVVAAFLVTSKVYSPQYVLWLLPLMILARPRWREWVIFTAGELVYFGAIWWHLGGFLTPGNSGADRIYWLAVLTRLATQLWVVSLVVRDALVPKRDPVRAGGADDPSGGPLDRAVDGAWAKRLHGGSVVPSRAA